MPLPPDRFHLAPFRPVALDDLVRVGRAFDGGYVISRRSLQAARVLVGLGINGDWSFESDFVAANPAVRVVGVDGSVSANVFRRWSAGRAARGALAAARGDLAAARRGVREAAEHLQLSRELPRFFDGERHRFVQRFITDTDGPSSLTWRALVAEHLPPAPTDGRPDVFVKMDIEGSEYRVLPDLLADGARITGMAIEFHDCDLLWERFEEFMAAASAHFHVAHLHGNNYVPLIAGTRTPRVLELSLVNRRLVEGAPAPSAAAFPLAGLDAPNDPARPDYPLEF